MKVEGQTVVGAVNLVMLVATQRTPTLGWIWRYGLCRIHNKPAFENSQIDPSSYDEFF